VQLPLDKIDGVGGRLALDPDLWTTVKGARVTVSADDLMRFRTTRIRR
jgi:hypothetical protein